MAQSFPFFFTAGGGQPAPLPKEQNSQATNRPSQTQDGSAQQMMPQVGALADMDMSALAGVSPEQLRLIARLFQSGALQLPPPAPGAPTQSSVAPHPPQAQPRHKTEAAQGNGMDVDEEYDGEVESEASETIKQRGFLHPPPTGPRSRSVTPRDRLRLSTHQHASARQPLNQGKPYQLEELQSVQMKGVTTGTNPGSKDAATKLFVLEMVKAGNTFEQLAAELRNPRPLIRMFKDLGLAVPSNYISNQPKGTAPLPMQGSMANSQSFTNEEKFKAAATHPPAPTKPVDRGEYLARLQAAKNKKADATSGRLESPKLTQKRTEASPNVKRTERPESGGAAISGNRPAAAVKAMDKTALARQKLEALRAQQAAKENTADVSGRGQSTSSPGKTSLRPEANSRAAISSPVRSSLRDTLADIAVGETNAASPPLPLPPLPIKASQLDFSMPTIFSPTPPTLNRSFSGLPGLFMVDAESTPLERSLASSQPATQAVSGTGLPQTQSSIIPAWAKPVTTTPTASPTPLTVPRKRPVAADFDDVSEKPIAAKRPFGQSRGTSEDESLIIEVSDDEDEDDEMDVDPAPESASKADLRTKPFRDAGPLRDFPPRSSFQTLVSSPATPGTPGGITYEQKMKEIEELRRKLAEKEQRLKPNGKIVTATSAATADATPDSAYTASGAALSAEQPTLIPATPPLAFETSATNESIKSTLQTAVLATQLNGSSERPMSVAQGVRQQEMQKLIQRMLELEQVLKNSDEVVETPAAKHDNTISEAPALPSSAEPVETLAQQTEEEQGQEQEPVSGTLQESPENHPSSAATDIVSASLSEDGEINDKPATILLGSQDAHHARHAQLALSDDGRIGSQATTATPSGMEPPDESNIQDFAQDTAMDDMADVEAIQIETAQPVAQSDLITPIESPSQGDETKSQEDGGGVYLSAVPTIQAESVLDEPAQEDDESEEESDEDNDDLDNLQGSTIQHQDDFVSMEIGASPGDDINDTIPHRIDNAPPAAVVSGGYDSGNDNRSEGEVSSDASSTYEQEYEPEPFEMETLATGDVGNNDGQDTTSSTAISELAVEASVTGGDLAPELQTREERQAEIFDQKPAKSKTYFTPYRSALMEFKDYRYHPEFLNTVPGGYRSMTYNHNIDPATPLCPYETSGGKCNDDACQHQHFKAMSLNDNELLKNMCMKNVPVRSVDERKRWDEGLNAVVKHLKSTNLGHDANAIATRIAEFRRQYVGDPTKVLNLG